MSSFTEELARKSAEAAHKKRKDASGVVDEVRASLAAQWQSEEPNAWKEATEMTKSLFKMTFLCPHTFITPDQMLGLLPQALAADVEDKEITCFQNNANPALYHFEFWYGHKRDRILAKLEEDDPSAFKRARVEDEPQGDAALEVPEESVELIKASVGERVQKVRSMPSPHRHLMSRAVEALGFTVGPLCALELAWERALLNQKGREASVAYAAAIAEIEAE